MKKKLFLALILIFGSLWTFGQRHSISQQDMAILKNYEDTLGLVSFLVVNDSLPENRFASTKKLIKTLVQALKVKNSFDYPFERMRSVSIQYPADSTFRIFTWQLYVDVDEYHYYGAIQMNTPELKLFPLIDRSQQVADIEQAILTPENWYGALYYNIRQFDTPTGRKYLLFGFDGYSLFNKRKLIDVLQFNNGEATFGAPVFEETDPQTGVPVYRNRILKEYSAESSFRLNYDETFGLIMFDHLILAGGNYGQGPVMVTDGSYEGYQLADGKWIWIEKVFDQVQDEAPRPNPILDNQKKDLFGKEKQQ